MRNCEYIGITKELIVYTTMDLLIAIAGGVALVMGAVTFKKQNYKRSSIYWFASSTVWGFAPILKNLISTIGG